MHTQTNARTLTPQDIHIILPPSVDTLLVLLQHSHVDVAMTLGAFLPLSENITRVVVILMPCCLVFTPAHYSSAPQFLSAFLLGLLELTLPVCMQDVSRFAPIPPVAIYEIVGMATNVALCEVFELDASQVHEWTEQSLHIPSSIPREDHHMIETLA
jgi:hypothetical protein